MSREVPENVVPEPGLEYRVEIARALNRGGVSAAPLARLALVSIFDDDEYENYDIDFVSPRRRLRIAKLLKGAGFRQTSGSSFAAPKGDDPIVLPKPGILGTDPSRPAGELLARGGAVVLVTPTQALLLYLHRFGDRLPEHAEELRNLVWEQPANLEKVRDWARAAGKDHIFARLRGKLEEAQAEGIELRRARRFRSRLPR